MRTTMAMVYDVLAKSFSARKGHAFDPAVTVTAAYDHFDASVESLSEGAYVVEHDHFASNDGFLKGCPNRVIAISSDGKADLDCCAICIEGKPSASDVTASIEDGLWRYKSILEEMTTMALQGSSYQRLVDKAHEFVGNPILVEDSAMRVKASTASDTMDDEFWSPFDPNIIVQRRVMSTEAYLQFMDEMNRRHEVMNHRIENGNVLNACRTREVGGQCLYSYLIQKNHEITEGDMDVLRHLSSMIELVMKTTVVSVAETLGYNGLLSDAIEGKLTDFDEFQNRMRALGHELKSYSNIIVVTSRKGCLNDRQAHKVLNDIENTFLFGKGMCYEGRLVFYMTYSDSKGVSEAELRRFEPFLSRFNLVAAVGHSSPAGSSIKNLYHGVIVTLSIGRRLFPEKNLHLFADCHPYWILEYCFREGNPDLYYHPALRLVSAVDAEKGTSLYPVLAKLAENRGNRSLTAKELYMQRNTLQSRIREIESLCGIDLADPETMSHIRRSLTLQRYCLESMG